MFFLLICLVWVEPGDEFMNEEPIEFAYKDQVNSENFAALVFVISVLCSWIVAFLTRLGYNGNPLIVRLD